VAFEGIAACVLQVHLVHLPLASPLLVSLFLAGLLVDVCDVLLLDLAEELALACKGFFLPEVHCNYVAVHCIHVVPIFGRTNDWFFKRAILLIPLVNILAIVYICICFGVWVEYLKLKASIL